MYLARPRRFWPARVTALSAVLRRLVLVRVSRLLGLDRCAGLLLVRVSGLLGLDRYAGLLPWTVSRLLVLNRCAGLP